MGQFGLHPNGTGLMGAPTMLDNQGGKRAGAGRPVGAASARRVALSALADIAACKSAPTNERLEAAQAILQAGMTRFMAARPLSQGDADAC